MSSPFSESPSDAAMPSQQLSEEKDETRILIVDDDEAVSGLFRTYLSERYECYTASNFDEAVALLQSKEFMLVLSDMIMPGRSGIELLREINARFPETAVIMVSGIDRTQRVLDAVRLGAFDYLIKPCELDVLGMTVERALERHALLHNARQYKLDLERSNAELRQSKAELEHRKSELERLQAQIVHTEKMASLGQLAAGVAHELNNPAGFIYSNIALLKDYIKRLERCLTTFDDLALPPAAAERIREMKTEIGYDDILMDLDSILSDCHIGAERIRDIVQNLRLFSRLDEAELKPVDLNEGIEATLRLLSIYYKSGRIRLLRDYGELPQVNCYAAQLNQVWMNLLINAAQAIGEAEGEVRIKTQCEGENVIVSVSDTGTGIEPEHLRNIFNPFFTTKPVGEGTGLGLSISHGVIVRHGGAVVVDSTPARGTTFTITIPVDAKPVATNVSEACA